MCFFYVHYLLLNVFCNNNLHFEANLFLVDYCSSLWKGYQVLIVLKCITHIHVGVFEANLLLVGSLGHCGEGGPMCQLVSH